MPLRVLTGTANAGKTGVIHASLRDRIGSGGRALLLLPSPADVSRAMTELAADCPTGLEITTLGAHLDTCWRSVGDGRRLVTAVQRAVVLEESGKSVDAGCLAGSSGTPGFRRMLTALVQRAAESCLAPDMLDDGGDPGACLLRYVRAYMGALKDACLVERGEAYRLVADRTRMLDLPELVAFNRFTGFTSPQEQYVGALAARCDVLVALTYTPRLPATEAAAGLVSRLATFGEVVELAAEQPASATVELSAIEREFSVSEREPLRSMGAVRISLARGRASEAARIVAEVQDACSSGIDPGGIAIVLRDPAAHIRALRFALDEAGYSAGWDLQIPFERTGFGRAVLGLLSLCAGSGDRVTWMDFMRSPYSPMSIREIDDIDARIRRQGVRGPEAVRLLDAWLKGESSAFMRDARAAYRGMSGEDTESRWHVLSTAMLGRAYPSGRSLPPEGMLDSAAIRVLTDAVAGLRDVVSTDDRASILRAALRGAPVSVSGAVDGRRVQVMSAERVRGRRYRCVIVGGLNAGEFPRMRRDDGYGALGADVALERAGIDTSSRDDVAAERLLFYQVITRARERLVLSCRSHDDGGQPLQSSIFLEEVLDLYRRSGNDDSPDQAAPLCTALGIDIGCSGSGAPITARRHQRSVVHSHAQGLGPTGEFVSAGSPPGGGGGCDEGLRLRDDTRAELSARAVFSVSDIETYLQCPYRWFIERVIRPHDLDTRIDASSAGQAGHEVLARVYDRFVSETGERRVTPETLEHALALLPSVIDESLARVRAETAQEAAELQRAVRATAGVLRADASLLACFEPLYREWSFGMAEGDPTEVLDGYELRGRIDRIDCSDSHLFITDYKLGSVGAERGVARFEDGGLVQLPLYAYVASRRFDLDVAGAVYRSITKGEMRGFVVEGLRGKPFVSTDIVDAAGVQRVIESARERAYEAVRGMRAGEIDATPSRGRCSPYCVAKSFCPGWERNHA